MSDLSIPSEAADWANSWLRHAATPHYNATPELLTHRREKVLRRIADAVAELSVDPIQAKRCAGGIAVLQGILARET